jgi:hypothetical protein
MNDNEPLFDTIETQRVSLRCVQEDDARIVATLMTPTVSRWLASWPSRITEEAMWASARGRDELCVFYWIQRERLSR